jgi:hypothetical protein
MKRIISICAECKKELKMAGGAVIEQALVTTILNEKIVYSHGICFECGVKLYGGELMAEVIAKMNYTSASFDAPNATMNEISFR